MFAQSGCYRVLSTDNMLQNLLYENIFTPQYSGVGTSFPHIKYLLQIWIVGVVGYIADLHDNDEIAVVLQTVYHVVL